MHRLVVHPGTPQAWDIRLKPGANSIGRSSSNHFSINDPSVSSAHCEILVANDSVRIKDLGSTNGTFVDRVRIREAPVQAGQQVRLGSVELLASDSEPARAPINLAEIARMELPAAPAPPPPPPVAVKLHTASSNTETAVIAAPTPEAIESAEPVFCKNHYQNAALYQCPKCNRYLCDLCVNTRGSASGGLKSCKICASPCTPVSIKAHVPKAVDYFKSLPQAFKYPVLGDGVWLLACGAVFFGALDLANYISLHASMYDPSMRTMMLRTVLFTFVFGTGYLFSYLKKIVHATASGDPRMPDWPDFTEWQADIVAPMFQFLIISLLSFGPAILLRLWFEGEYQWLVWLAALLGCGYFPMGMLGVAMFDTLNALNPPFVIGSIARVPREYSVAALIFAGILVIRWLLETGLAMILPLPLAPALLADLIGIYLLIVETRILGLLYLSQKGSLGWFK